MNTPSEAELMRTARRRVAMKTGWLTHALVYVLVNGGLWLLNTAQGGERWSVWPLAGWGAGLAIHGIVVLVALTGDGWRQRWVEREAQRLRDRR